MSNTGSDRLANASADGNGDSHVCAECDRLFRTNRVLNQHLRSCYLKNKTTDVQTPYERNEDKSNDQTTDDSNIEIQDISTPSLINGAIIKITCLREIHLSLTKK